MIDAELEAVKISKMGGGGSPTVGTHTQRVSTPPPGGGGGGYIRDVRFPYFHNRALILKVICNLGASKIKVGKACPTYFYFFTYQEWQLRYIYWWVFGGGRRG